MMEEYSSQLRYVLCTTIIMYSGPWGNIFTVHITQNLCSLGFCGGQRVCLAALISGACQNLTATTEAALYFIEVP